MIDYNNFIKINFNVIEVGKLYQHSNVAFQMPINSQEKGIIYFPLSKNYPCIFLKKDYVFLITKKTKEESFITFQILFGHKLYHRSFIFSKNKKQIPLFKLIT